MIDHKLTIGDNIKGWISYKVKDKLKNIDFSYVKKIRGSWRKVEQETDYVFSEFDLKCDNCGCHVYSVNETIYVNIIKSIGYCGKCYNNVMRGKK